MQQMVEEFSTKQKKQRTVAASSGDTVRVHQRISEGGKTRTQVFEGLVIRVDKANSHLARITVRRIASGVGVEKSFQIHSPLVEKIEVIKRSKVRRNYLSYMRQRHGKSARLSGIEFDRDQVNAANVVQAEPKSEESDKPAEAKTDAESTDNQSNQPEKDNNQESEPTKTDKQQEKKAKAEQFRQAHEGK